MSELAGRGRGPPRRARRSGATGSTRSSARAAWARSTGPPTCGSAAWWRSRCSPATAATARGPSSASSARRGPSRALPPQHPRRPRPGVEGDLAYTVMELLEGETLAERLARGALPWRETAALGSRSRGPRRRPREGRRPPRPEARQPLPHRGRSRPDPRLRDRPAAPGGRGGARGAAGPRPGRRWGRSATCRPSRRAARRSGPASDLFSLGCVLYEMAAGTPAFRRGTTAETVAAILRDPPPPLRRLDGRPAPRAAPGHRALPAEGPRARPGLGARGGGALSSPSRSRSGWPPGHRHGPCAPRAIGGAGAGRAAAALAAVAARRGRLRLAAARPSRGVARSPSSPSRSRRGGRRATSATASPRASSPTSAPVRGLRVMARSTAFRYRDRGLDPRQTGRELEGGRRPHRPPGRGARATWSWTPSSSAWRTARGSGAAATTRPADLARTQADISERLSDSLRLRLTSDQRRRLGRPETASPRAYELYLKGRYAWNQRTLGGRPGGPAPLPAGRGRGPGLRPRLRRHRGQLLHPRPDGPGRLSREEAYERQRAAALRAVELDPTLAEAWASLGLLKQLYEWDWDEAGRAFERAIELNPVTPGPLVVRRLPHRAADASMRPRRRSGPRSSSIPSPSRPSWRSPGSTTTRAATRRRSRSTGASWS